MSLLLATNPSLSASDHPLLPPISSQLRNNQLSVFSIHRRAETTDRDSHNNAVSANTRAQ
jgi:hypothetical protein